ncbi:MAG: hypothetical protein J7K66_02145 [Anaerolineaceae bacterium]|nr:hypothetical protein [Anaerolineaceae bacterium]
MRKFKFKELPYNILFIVVFVLIVTSSCCLNDYKVSQLIHFSGLNWNVRQVEINSAPAQPGNNYFSSVYGQSESVYVDKQGRLHLAIVQRQGVWYSAEVKSVIRASCGIYKFQVILPNDPPLDPKIAVAIFIYADNTHEFDIEISKFLSQFDCSLIDCESCISKCENCKIQYVRQPFCDNKNWQRFPWPKSIRETNHTIKWNTDGSVQFFSKANIESNNTIISCTLPAHPDNIESSGEFHLHLSIWMMDEGGSEQPNTPFNLKKQEVIFEPITLPDDMTMVNIDKQRTF